jgi:hypothetical protein
VPFFVCSIVAVTPDCHCQYRDRTYPDASPWYDDLLMSHFVNEITRCLRLRQRQLYATLTARTLDNGTAHRELTSMPPTGTVAIQNIGSPSLFLVERDERMARMEAVAAYVDAQMGADLSPLPVAHARLAEDVLLAGGPAAPRMMRRGLFLTPWFYLGTRWVFVVGHNHNVETLEPVLANGDRDIQVNRLLALLEERAPLTITLA